MARTKRSKTSIKRARNQRIRKIELRKEVRSFLQRSGYSGAWSIKNNTIDKISKGYATRQDGSQSIAIGGRLKRTRDGRLVNVRSQGESVIDRMADQFRNVFKGDVERFGSLAQQAAAENVNEYYGFNVWQKLKNLGVSNEDIDISGDKYLDPETGEEKNISSLWEEDY